ncbi:type VI secretion system tube protein Hcp [Azovibrio restrictus]|uniref:Hcp family type VI secretion system effector n=1 Tax=Azovibrio restrictus TaxID=146938 RepID=UPI0026EB3B03|nr:type VI secretion system tube protein Hcp [Azovibrio restrictus]MDD3482820.1 type VI secretion system tube protein Hcp [Azovibrio restrictus]
MAFDAFLKVDGIPGESTDDKHKDWIEILSYHQGVSQPASATASSVGGASAERVNFGALSISKQVDKASPKLFEACCTGKHIKEVIIEVCRSGGDKQKYLEIRLEQVIVSNYVQDGGGEFPHEGISLSAGKYKMIYSQQKRSDGSLGGNVAGGWDLTANKVYA